MSTIHFSVHDLANILAAAVADHGPDFYPKSIQSLAPALEVYSLANTVEYMERYHERADVARAKEIASYATTLIRQKRFDRMTAVENFASLPYKMRATFRRLPQTVCSPWQWPSSA